MAENNLSFAISTFGCKVNQYESQVIRERLLAAGYRENPDSPELIVINSCAVTARAEAKTRKCIRRCLRRVPRARVVIIGCGLTYSESRDRSMWEIIPPLRRGELPHSIARDGLWGITFSAEHSRAFVKVQNGCDSFCSYCIIPFLRGGPVSRTPEGVDREVAGLIHNGYREIVLTGIHLGIYGKDDPEYRTDLVGLVERLLKLPGQFRIRLSSIEPKEICPRLVQLIAEEEKLCPHLHIPLQSGSDHILRKMNRNYTIGEYYEIIRSLRSASPDISISTDCLVGFPGEREEDFQDSRRAVREIGFGKVHIFPYSRRDGTGAARYPSPDRENIRRRVDALREISEAAALESRKRFLGREVEVIIEKMMRDGLYSGLDGHYIRVLVSGEKCGPGTLCRVWITGVDENGLKGEVV